MAFSNAWWINPSRSKNPGHRRRHHRFHGGEPASPKISCMGQIKCGKLLPQPLPPPIPLRRSLPLLAQISDSSSSSKGSSWASVYSSVKSTKLVTAPGRRNGGGGGGMGAFNVEEMDRPLPVVKMKDLKSPEADNLWKRRFAGRVDLGELQIFRQTRLPAANSGVLA